MITVAQIMQARSYDALVHDLKRNKLTDEELLDVSESYRQDLIISLAVIAAGACVLQAEHAKLGLVAMYQVGHAVYLYAFGTLIGELQLHGTKDAVKQPRYQQLANKVMQHG